MPGTVRSSRFAKAVVMFVLSANLLIAYAGSPAVSNPATAPNAVVEQPRPFGYVIGDVLTQRVLLESDGHEFEPAALPRGERIGAWLERRVPRIEKTADGRRWLVVDYQLINAPQALKTVSVPAWELKLKSAGNVLRIGEWPISVAPLTPRSAFAKGGLDELRANRPAPSVATEPLQRGMALTLSALILTLVAWLGWLLWRNWRASSSQPFARALREIRHVDESAPDAWQALHRAFDRTAGKVTQSASLAVLFQRAPQFESLRPKIEQFFAQSSDRFFSSEPPIHPVELRALCRDLRRIEKQHER